MSLDPGVTYRLLADPEELRLAAQLLGWTQRAPGEPDSRAAGSFLLGAFEGERLVGAAASRLTPDDARPPRVEQDQLRVTSLAVVPSASGRGVGGSLMRLQRMLGIQQGVRLVTWVQDPLDGRLAHLAIHKLGAVSRQLLAGPGIGGDGMLDIEWWVSAPRVKTRLAGGRPELDLAHALEAGAPKLNAGWLDDDGLLQPTGGEAPPDAALALVEMPYALEDLKVRAPGLVEVWRSHLTHILTQAFSLGYWLTDYLWLRGERVPRAYYLLIDGERTLG